MSNLISQGNMFGSVNTQTQQNYLTAGGGTFSFSSTRVEFCSPKNK